jgi:ABC-type glycerol-3-phosphate transport system substrate-binding protein
MNFREEMKMKTKIFWMLLALGLGLFALGGAGCATGAGTQDACAPSATLEELHAEYSAAYGPNIRYWPAEAQRAWRAAFEKAEVQNSKSEIRHSPLP